MIFARLKSLFLPLFAFVTAREKCFFLKPWVVWLILTFTDRTYLVFCFLGYVCSFSLSFFLFCFFSFQLLAFFLLYLYLYYVRKAGKASHQLLKKIHIIDLASSRSNAHTHTNKGGAKRRGKAERRQRAARCLTTRFVDNELMFGSRGVHLVSKMICFFTAFIIPGIVAFSERFLPSSVRIKSDALFEFSQVAQVIQLFGERLTQKVHATTPKGIVGGFECTVLQRNFEEWQGMFAMLCLRSPKESIPNLSRFDSHSR